MGEQLLGGEMLRLGEGGGKDGEPLVGDPEATVGEIGFELAARLFGAHGASLPRPRPLSIRVWLGPRLDCGPGRGCAKLVKYKVALYPSEGGWAVSCPALPGCHSQGETEAEALTNIGEAIRDYLEVKLQLLAEEGALVREIELTEA